MSALCPLPHTNSPLISHPATPSSPAVNPFPIIPHQQTYLFPSVLQYTVYTGQFPFTLCQIVYCACALAFQPSVLPAWLASLIPCLPFRPLPLCLAPLDEFACFIYLPVFFLLLPDLWLCLNMNYLTRLPLSRASGFKPVSLLCHYTVLLKSTFWKTVQKSGLRKIVLLLLFWPACDSSSAQENIVTDNW